MTTPRPPAADLPATWPALARGVAQAAEASRLLGVDFVPVYRTTRPGDGTPPPAPPTPVAPAEAQPAAPAPAPAAPDAAHPERARRRAALNAVLERYERDAPHQHFVTDHHRIVFDDGDPCADLMFIGEAPGADEDRIGRPFVGRAGQLLDKMITAMGLSRPAVYIANVLKTRPPNNATPTLDEARLCAPYLFEQIAIVRPKVIVTLGLPASRLLLNSTDSMASLRGVWAEFPPPLGAIVPAPRMDPVAVMPTYHPAFLLRAYTPDNRAKVWSDLQKVMVRLGLTPPSAGAAESQPDA